VTFSSADSERDDPEHYLEACDLTCIRDDQVLFDGLTFRVDSKQVLLIEGRNGSGKTSLLRILCGLGLQDGGEVKWCGESIERLGAGYHEHLAYVGHHDGIKRDLTVLENLHMAQALDQPGRRTIDQALEKVNLWGYEEVQAHALSAGQRRRLALARLLVTDNSLWILDEPFTAMDKEGIAAFEQLIVSHAGNGGLVVLTSHHSLNCDGADVQRIDLS
jgi:heme exporter protein A